MSFLSPGACVSGFQDDEVGHKECIAADSVIGMQRLPYVQELSPDGIMHGNKEHSHCTIGGDIVLTSLLIYTKK